MTGWQWHRLDQMQIICTSIQTNMPVPHQSVFTGRIPFLPPNQQRKIIEGNKSLKAACSRTEPFRINGSGTVTYIHAYITCTIVEHKGTGCASYQPLTQPTVARQWRKCKSLTPNSFILSSPITGLVRSSVPLCRLSLAQVPIRSRQAKPGSHGV